MKKTLILLVALLVGTIAAATRVSSNSTPIDLLVLQAKIITGVQSQKPEWQYRSVPPIEGSADVILMQWSFENHSVRIAITSHASIEDAVKAMATLRRDGKELETLPDLADVGGFSWGRGTVTFRKDNLTVSSSAVDTTVTRDAKEVAQKVPEERALSKDFAKLVAAIIKDE